tara:strand:- start:140 stop:625 length:486 start_codon:yes stop_codon:yes gene_type:complete
MRIFILIAVLIIGNFTAANAEKIDFNKIIIDNIWIKETPPNHKVTSGYLTIKNLSDADETLLSVSSSFAEKGEIHHIKMDSEVMKMRPITGGLFIPIGETVYLEPGGFHLMFMNLNMQIIPKQAYRITLTFQNLGSVVVSATVKSTHTGNYLSSERHNHWH